MDQIWILLYPKSLDRDPAGSKNSGSGASLILIPFSPGEPTITLSTLTYFLNSPGHYYSIPVFLKVPHQSLIQTAYVMPFPPILTLKSSSIVLFVNT